MLLESVQANNSSKNQVHCCHKWWELRLNVLRRNSRLKYVCWLRKAGFGKSAHVSHVFDSARNTMSQSFVVAQLIFFKRTDSDNYKNTAAALFSQKSEILLPHLLFVHIYKYMHLIYMCLSVYTNIHYIFFFVVLLVYFLPFLWVSANFQACASNSKGKLYTFSF